MTPENRFSGLQLWLDARFGPADYDLRPIAGGQSNPTCMVDHGDRRMVLRTQPLGPILKGAHAIDREYRVLQALQGQGVPVPEPILYCADDGVIGRPFYLMQRLDGRVFHDNSLPGIAPSERGEIFAEMARVMAALHAVDPVQVGLGDFGRPEGYYPRQIARWWQQYQNSQLLRDDPITALAPLHDWLSENLPDQDERVSIAHGDFRLGNLIFSPDAPRVIGILDWELSTLGPALADLGFACMAWRTSPDQFGGIAGLDLDAMGIPDRHSFVAHYYDHAAPTPPLQPFHEAFALFRFSAIFVGIADRAAAGNAAGQGAGDLAPLAATFAERGLQIAKQV
ncbi:phosphotransferase family protein [Paracoccus sp. SM22M-07]|uniref:phosphotransferase family protein n=1 Tax=Paracoccus sp. SM22M-07 TaxID=1520813 RepID=UPI00091BB1A1|nr:phosphotransferase family protein [Paracoccus sp. SM22M-07]OJH43601.1 aminoglycoside phosphotransferase [Paracoccus sp. SM22M-07]